MTILPKGTKLWMQEGPSNLHFVYYPGYAGTIELKNQCEIYPKLILTMVKDSLFLYAYDEPDMLELSQRILSKEIEKKGYSIALI